jgi:malonyl-CoA O-methyltransferase
MALRRASASVVSAFDAAAATYDSSSALQQQVAERLIARVGPMQPQTVLDIGCGTGRLTRLIAERWPNARIFALDASRAMLEQLSAKLPNVRAIHGDAASIPSSQRYDLILSSMALHWLAQPRSALLHWSRLLNEGGRLHVALPVEGSLTEWREACASIGLRDGLWNFPSADFADGLETSSEIVTHRVAFGAAREFLESMKRTGAHRSRAGHRPAPAGKLRGLLQRYDSRFIATFRVLYLSAEGGSRPLQRGANSGVTPSVSM